MTTRRIVLAGNPNCGKTTLFNRLTGAQQHVGNYGGVTVEKRVGHYTHNGTRHAVTDLPGTYSLSSYSPEERIAQHELLTSEPEVIVAVADSTVLSRSLVLLTQLMLIDTRIVLCLNMSDEAESSGQKLDIALLEQLLGFPIVQTVGHRGKGADQLKDVIAHVAAQPKPHHRLVLGERMDTALTAICDKLDLGATANPARRWIAARLLAGDISVVEQIQSSGTSGAEAIAIAEQHRHKIESETDRDISLFVTECYYGFVHGLLNEIVISPARSDARAASDAVDRVLAHPLLGLPFFFAVMYGVFWIAFSVGETPMHWLESGFAWLGNWTNSLWSEPTNSITRSLIVDGIIGGVGGVVVFLPNIVLLFLCLSLLEDTGYLSRAAFLVDRAMHRFGLHGKSFIPLVTGFGCSIPGIMATRTLENERDRLSTMLVLPLMSCGARLPIWMLLIPAFFAPVWHAPILWAIYVIGIALALLLVLALRKTVLRGEEAPFVMELPPYRIPTMRSVITRMIDRSWIYLRKAGTVILAISIVLWILTAYPKPPSHTPSPNPTQTNSATVNADALRYSIAGRIGQAIEPVIAPLGFDWRVGTAMLGAIAAKEVFVAQMGIVYSLGESGKHAAQLRTALRRDYSPLAAFSLMLFLLIGTPCMATIAVTRRESGSWRWALFQMIGLTAIAYLVSLFFYQGGMLITQGRFDALSVVLAVVICSVLTITIGWTARRHTAWGRNAQLLEHRTKPSVCSTCVGCPGANGHHPQHLQD